MLEALRWYLALQLFGIALLPLALHFFRFLPDRGYAFARPLGLLLVGYLLWICGVFGLLENSPATILVLLLIAAGASWAVFRSQIARLRYFWRRNRGHILAIEGIFLVSFCVWVVIRAYNPEIQATEKPMEFAFLNATLRSTQLPPLDPWLSGYSISYYYFGYLFIAMIASLTQVPSSIAFNLAIPTIFALTATGAYSVGWNLAEGIIRGPKDSAGDQTRPKRLIGPWFAGACTLFTILIMSNWEIFLELLHSKGVGAASFWKSIGIQGLSRPYNSGQLFPLDSQDHWWWFRASRVIGDYNSADGSALDYTINEFPFFSFILGDVHPHVLALPFVFLTIGYTLNLFRSDASLTAGKLLRNPIHLAFIAIVYGGLWVLNAWDMPTQLFMLAIVVAVGHSVGSSGSKSNWLYEALLVFAVTICRNRLVNSPANKGIQTSYGGLSISRRGRRPRENAAGGTREVAEQPESLRRSLSCTCCVCSRLRALYFGVSFAGFGHRVGFPIDTVAPFSDFLGTPTLFLRIAAGGANGDRHRGRADASPAGGRRATRDRNFG